MMMQTTRITVTLPTEYLTQLMELARENVVPSVNYAVKEAVKAYLDQIKKMKYESLMAEAAEDKDFMKRTLDCANDFSYVDSEVPGEW